MLRSSSSSVVRQRGSHAGTTQTLVVERPEQHQGPTEDHQKRPNLVNGTVNTIQRSPARSRTGPRREWERLRAHAIASAEDRKGAIALIERLTDTGTLLKGVEVALDRIDHGVALVSIKNDVIVGARDEPIDPALLPKWLHGLVRLSRFPDATLKAELALMAEPKIETGGAWKAWGHHGEMTGRAYRVSEKNGGEPLKRAFLPSNAKRFHLPPEARQDLREERLQKPWTTIVKDAVDFARHSLPKGSLPRKPKRSARTRSPLVLTTTTQQQQPSRRESGASFASSTKQTAPRGDAVSLRASSSQRWMPFEDDDWAVNVNYMRANAYYPAHTDDWQQDPHKLPDIDGSGHHILTYSSTRALVLVAPVERAGVGALAFVVEAGDVWGMRSPSDDDGTLVPSARYDAVHAVVNLSNTPRFSVNFRLGGFDSVFNATSTTARPPRGQRPGGEPARQRPAAPLRRLAAHASWKQHFHVVQQQQQHSPQQQKPPSPPLLNGKNDRLQQQQHHPVVATTASSRPVDDAKQTKKVPALVVPKIGGKRVVPKPDDDDDDAKTRGGGGDVGASLGPRPKRRRR